MQSNFNELLRNNIWELLPPNPFKNIITCKWSFCIKSKLHGSIDHYIVVLLIKHQITQMYRLS